jgi:hypothetical protein
MRGFMDNILALNKQIKELRDALNDLEDNLHILLNKKAEELARFKIGDKIESPYGRIVIKELEGYLHIVDGETKFNIAYRGDKITKTGEIDKRCFVHDTIFENEFVGKFGCSHNNMIIENQISKCAECGYHYGGSRLDNNLTKD